MSFIIINIIITIIEPIQLLYRFICPIEGIGMLLWWIIDEMINNSDPYYPNQPWWEFTSTSLITIVTQVCRHIE